MSRTTLFRARLAITAAMVAVAAIRLGAQATKPPVAKPAPVYAFPKVQTRTLPNGLVVQIVEDHALPLVAVRTVIEGGALLDPAGKEGLYALDLSLLRDGTAAMNGEQLAQAIDQMGATVTPTSFTAITDELAQALPLMGEMLMHPTFPAEAVDRRKAATTSTLQRAEGQAPTAANRILNAVLFGPDHPLGRTATPASIAAITRDDLVRFHDANVRPQNVTLVIVGDVVPATVMPLVTRVFGSWEKTGERAVVKMQTTIPAQPTWVCDLEVANPRAPAASASWTIRRIAPISSAVASRSVASSPMTYRRTGVCPISAPRLIAVPRRSIARRNSGKVSNGQSGPTPATRA